MEKIKHLISPPDLIQCDEYLAYLIKVKKNNVLKVLIDISFLSNDNFLINLYLRRYNMTYDECSSKILNILRFLLLCRLEFIIFKSECVCNVNHDIHMTKLINFIINKINEYPNNFEIDNYIQRINKINKVVNEYKDFIQTL